MSDTPRISEDGSITSPIERDQTAEIQWYRMVLARGLAVITVVVLAVAGYFFSHTLQPAHSAAAAELAASNIQHDQALSDRAELRRLVGANAVAIGRLTALVEVALSQQN
jgi:hypothetical protein